VTEVSDTELLERFPDTWINHDNKEFYRGWLQRRLLLNRCADCGSWQHPPKPVCRSCWSTNVVASEVSGRGTVHLLIRLHQGPPAPGVDYATPLPVATVELEEQVGLRYTSGVVNCAPDQLRIGLPVRLTWVDRYDAPYPVFEPRPEEGGGGT
jgi:uncharacterized OB-fold protein